VRTEHRPSKPHRWARNRRSVVGRHNGAATPYSALSAVRRSTNVTVRYHSRLVRDPYRLSRDRVWFLDDREPPRRLQVTHHPDSRVVVFSLWPGDLCTATFRLPVEDAPAMIEVLVAGLAQAATESATGAAEPAATPRPSWRRAVRSWVEARLNRRSA
jgi:hypothetical protein